MNGQPFGIGSADSAGYRTANPIAAAPTVSATRARGLPIPRMNHAATREPTSQTPTGRATSRIDRLHSNEVGLMSGTPATAHRLSLKSHIRAGRIRTAATETRASDQVRADGPFHTSARK